MYLCPETFPQGSQLLGWPHKDGSQVTGADRLLFPQQAIIKDGLEAQEQLGKGSEEGASIQRPFHRVLRLNIIPERDLPQGPGPFAGLRERAGSEESGC